MSVADDILAVMADAELGWDPSRVDSSLVAMIHRATEASGNYERVRCWIMLAIARFSIHDWESAPGRTLDDVLRAVKRAAWFAGAFDSREAA